MNNASHSGDSHDLTRWNRAGLRRFRYIDGNAATFLDGLRAALSRKFPQWKDLHVARPDVDTNADPEAAARELDRVVQQYDRHSGEWGWELARTLARASHILTEHIDAYANESYVGTATQWENLRRLVSMLDYHPAPPASAITRLVIDAKPGPPDVLQRGFQVKHTPADGRPPIIFETLEDVEVDANLNALRPKGYNRNPQRLGGNQLELEGRVKNLNTGQPLVVEDERTPYREAYVIEGVREGNDVTVVNVVPKLSGWFVKGDVRVHVEPAESLDLLGPTPGTAELSIGLQLQLAEQPTELLPGEVIYITDGKNRYYRTVAGINGKRLMLSDPLGKLVSTQAYVSRPENLPVVDLRVGRTVVSSDASMTAVRVAGDWSRLYQRLVAEVRKVVSGVPRPVKELSTFLVTAAKYHPVMGGDSTERANEGYTVLTLSHQSGSPLTNPQGLLIPSDSPRTWRVDTFLETTGGKPPARITTEKTKRAAAGDLAVVQLGHQVAWAKLASVAVDAEAETAELTADGRWQQRGGGEFFLSETKLFTHFKQSACRVRGWTENRTPLKKKTEIVLSQQPAALKRGRRVLVEFSDQSAAAFMATVINVDLDQRTVVLDQALPDSARVGNVLLAGNVVLAGHGERQNPEIFGSGDVTRSNQSFPFEQEGVSFVPDPTQATGVRADIDVTLDQHTWQQVSTLANSGPTDPHYTVRMTEEGYLKITFGDGVRGRRAPSTELRIAFRLGTGLSGILSAGSLEKPVKPHRLVAAVRQTMPTSGGNDMETPESLRENAPAKLLTLQRAVSLSDFSRLATSQSSVWQANAFADPITRGRQQGVKVVVVPAGGGPLGELKTSLERFLKAHTLPAVRATVSDFEPIKLSLQIEIFVKTDEFDEEKVADEVRAALREAFSVKNRRLGQPVYRSELFQVVESIAGVEHSKCSFSLDPPVGRPKAWQLIHVPADEAEIDVTYKEFRL